MLIDQANLIVTRITNYKALKDKAHHALTFETRAGQLKKSATGLSDAVAKMKTLNANGITVAFKFTSNDQIRAKTEQLQQGFDNDPAYVDNPGFNMLHNYLGPIGGITDNIRIDTLKTWQDHVAYHRERISSDILNALIAVPEYRKIVTIVNVSQEHIDRLAASLPEDIELARKQLSKLTEDQREAWQQLTGGELPESVISFLRASMGEGAELKLLKPEVINWLKNRNLESAFRIKSNNAGRQ